MLVPQDRDPRALVYGPAEPTLHVVQHHNEGAVLGHLHKSGYEDLAHGLPQLLCHRGPPPGLDSQRGQPPHDVVVDLGSN